MEQNNKITISIESESQSDFSDLLVKTLQMCNVERNKENQRANLLEESFVREKEKHGKTKSALQTEKEEHEKTKSALQTEKEVHEKTKSALQTEKEEHEKTKSALQTEKEEHEKTKSALQTEKEEHKKTKSALQTEKEEHEKTKRALQTKKEEHNNTKEALNKLSNTAITKIKSIFDRIASLLDCQIENKPFADFVKAIIKTNDDGKYLWSDCSDIDSFLYKCKFETSFFSRIASLIWWNEQEELKYMTSCINRIDDLQPLVNSVVAILEVFDHSIKFPTGPMAETMYEYTSYENEPSNFIRIFSSEKMANNTLCEVRQLAIDGQEGEMFIYYK